MDAAQECEQKVHRLAIVGCGTVSERFHVPALRGFGGFAPMVMIDHDPVRARLLADQFPNAKTGADYHALRGKVDAAIVALPGHLNAKVTEDLLQMGIAVLVEKPAAVSVNEAKALLRASAEGARLAVGFIRREAVGVRLARQCIASGMLGRITSFSIEDGYVFNWQAVNEFRFDKRRGGGILNDIGSHVLDTLAYWFGPCRVVRCRDDNAGGVETNASLELETAGGVRGNVELSWTRELRNSAIIKGENGSLEVRWYTNDAVLTLANGLHSLNGAIRGDARLLGGAETFPQMFLAQIQRWHRSLLGIADASGEMAGAREALANTELISTCQTVREDMQLIWRQAPVDGQQKV